MSVASLSKVVALMENTLLVRCLSVFKEGTFWSKFGTSYPTRIILQVTFPAFLLCRQCFSSSESAGVIIRTKAVLVKQIRQLQGSSRGGLETNWQFFLEINRYASRASEKSFRPWYMSSFSTFSLCSINVRSCSSMYLNLAQRRNDCAIQ